MALGGAFLSNHTYLTGSASTISSSPPLLPFLYLSSSPLLSFLLPFPPFTIYSTLPEPSSYFFLFLDNKRLSDLSLLQETGPDAIFSIRPNGTRLLKANKPPKHANYFHWSLVDLFSQTMVAVPDTHLNSTTDSSHRFLLYPLVTTYQNVQMTSTRF